MEIVLILEHRIGHEAWQSTGYQYKF